MADLESPPWKPSGQGYWFPYVGQKRLGKISPLCIDSPRQFLHWGHAKKVVTYHLATMALAYQSTDHPVDAWESFCFDERRATLYAVGKVPGAVQRRVYSSGDGGRHITEVLTVDAKSSDIERDSERGYLVLLFQNPADDIIKRRISKDGGATWDAAINILVDSATSTTGVVQGITQDPRATGVMFATIKSISSTSVTVIRSRDSGKHWQTILS